MKQKTIKNFLFKNAFILYVLTLSLSSSLIYAESFRVHENIIHKIDLANPSSTVTLSINDALSIIYPEDLVYLQGIALDIKIPELAAIWRDSMAWSIFDTLYPVPQHGVIDYTGNALKFGILPSRLSLSLVIPLVENNTIKENPYATKFDFIPKRENGYLFLRLQQVMKGTPDEFDNIKFEVTVRPLLTNQGKFELELISPEKDSAVKQCALFIDEKPFDLNKDGFYLEAGVHTLSLVSEFYRSELRTIHIDQAKTTKLTINLRGIEPSVIINAPAFSTVHFDGKLLESVLNEFIIEEGEHTVRFTLGNYDIEKKFTAVKGNSYNISLNIEAEITEN